jgi:hypothetical protein
MWRRIFGLGTDELATEWGTPISGIFETHMFRIL